MINYNKYVIPVAAHFHLMALAVDILHRCGPSNEMHFQLRTAK